MRMPWPTWWGRSNRGGVDRAARCRGRADAVTGMAVFQTVVIGTCLFIMFRSVRSDKASREASRAWGRHPFTMRDLAKERGPDTEDGFVWKLGCSGIDATIARTLRREIQDLARWVQELPSAEGANASAS